MPLGQAGRAPTRTSLVRVTFPRGGMPQRAMPNGPHAAPGTGAPATEASSCSARRKLERSAHEPCMRTDTSKRHALTSELGRRTLKSGKSAIALVPRHNRRRRGGRAKAVSRKQTSGDRAPNPTHYKTEQEREERSHTQNCTVLRSRKCRDKTKSEGSGVNELIGSLLCAWLLGADGGFARSATAWNLGREEGRFAAPPTKYAPSADCHPGEIDPGR